MGTALENKTQVETQDELDKINIDQLHRATLNFSKNCLEVKKLCVTAEIAVITLLTGLYYEVWQSTELNKEVIQNELRILIVIFSIAIPALFYFVDVGFYYYQSKLRDKMEKLQCDIKKRHLIALIADNNYTSKTKSELIIKSLLNGSQLLYIIMILIAIIIAFFLWP